MATHGNGHHQQVRRGHAKTAGSKRGGALTQATPDERVDKALSDSFPASDAPPWTLGAPRWASRNATLRATKNDLAESVRKKMIELLNERLADAVDLHSQCKQAHWNVRGRSFFSLHALFDAIAKDAQEYADALAERAAQLGGFARGTARSAAKHSSLPEYPSGAASGADHVNALSDALAVFARAVRAAIDASDDIDADTTDLFTEISRGVDKWLWMVEAHTDAD